MQGQAWADLWTAAASILQCTMYYYTRNSKFRQPSSFTTLNLIVWTSSFFKEPSWNVSAWPSLSCNKPALTHVPKVAQAPEILLTAFTFVPRSTHAVVGMFYRIARNFGSQNFGGFGGLLSKRQNFNRQNRIYMGVYIRLGINPPKY